MSMTQEMAVKLKRSLISDEGCKSKPYLDTANPPNITIGIGYNLSDRGIDDDWINNQYNKDVTYFYNHLSTFSWFLNLNEDRQIALINMSFMGWKRFIGFEKMIDALSCEDYPTAYKEIINSDWDEQVKGRADRIANVILTGIYNI